MICRLEEQKNKVMQIEKLCRKKVRETVTLGERKVTRGMRSGIPVDDLENLRIIVELSNYCWGKCERD